MMPGPVLHRRNLIATVVAAAAAWLGRVPMAARGTRRPALPADSLLAAVCADLPCSAAIGTACLAVLPANEASTTSLARGLLEATQSGRMPSASTGALAQAIGQRSRDDFRDGRIVIVDGWMLSLTETRLYALATLMRPGTALTRAETPLHADVAGPTASFG